MANREAIQTVIDVLQTKTIFDINTFENCIIGHLAEDGVLGFYRPDSDLSSFAHATPGSPAMALGSELDLPSHVVAQYIYPDANVYGSSTPSKATVIAAWQELLEEADEY